MRPATRRRRGFPTSFQVVLLVFGDPDGPRVAEIQRGGGLITKDDPQKYQPVWREPVQIQWHGVNMVTAPPPSSGGLLASC
jgi:hypothetical protein